MPICPCDAATGRRLERNILRSYVMRVFIAFPMFCVPVMLPFWKSFGISVAEIAEFKFALMVTTLLLELPSGILADRFGRRLAMVLAAVGWIAANAIYLTSSTFLGFLAAEVLIALGMSMISGTDQAIIYESLEALGRKDEFSKVWGRAVTISLAAGAAASVLSGQLAAVWIRLPFAVVLSGSVVLLSTVALVYEPGKKVRGSAGAAPCSPARSSAGLLRLLFELKAATLVLLFIGGLLFSFTPLFRTFSQELLGAARFPITAYGYVFAGAQLAAAGAAAAAHRLERLLGGTWAIVLGAACLGGASAGAAMGTPALIVGCIWIYFCAEAFVNVVLSKCVQQESPSEVRATVFSSISLLGRLSAAVNARLFGLVGPGLGVQTTFRLFGAGVFVVTALLCLVRVAFERKRQPAEGEKKVFSLKENAQGVRC